MRVLVSVIVALVPLVSATLPVKLLLAPLVLKSIEVPAFKVVVPGTVTVPLSLIDPPEVKKRLPPLFKVTEGNTMLAEALLKLAVRLRKAVKEVKLLGNEAAALVLVRLKS